MKNEPARLERVEELGFKEILNKDVTIKVKGYFIILQLVLFTFIISCLCTVFLF